MSARTAGYPSLAPSQAASVDRAPIAHRVAAVRRRRRGLRIAQPVSPRAKVLLPVVTFVVLIAVWALVTGLGLVSDYFLPEPQAVLASFGHQAASGELWSDVVASVYRVMIGYLIASAMAVPLGLLLGAYAPVEALFEPVLDFVRYMPVVAFVPLTILWVGTGDLQKFTIIWMGTFFQQILMVAAEVQRVNPDLLRLGRTLGMSEPRILVRILVPASAPGVWDTLRVTLGWAWTWLVVAELVAATTGLGYRITVAQRYFETDTMLAYVMVLGVLGLIGDQIMRAARRRLFPHEH